MKLSFSCMIAALLLFIQTGFSAEIEVIDLNEKLSQQGDLYEVVSNSLANRAATLEYRIPEGKMNWLTQTHETFNIFDSGKRLIGSAHQGVYSYFSAHKITFVNEFGKPAGSLIRPRKKDADFTIYNSEQNPIAYGSRNQDKSTYTFDVRSLENDSLIMSLTRRTLFKDPTGDEWTLTIFDSSVVDPTWIMAFASFESRNSIRKKVKMRRAAAATLVLIPIAYMGYKYFSFKPSSAALTREDQYKKVKAQNEICKKVYQSINDYAIDGYYKSLIPPSQSPYGYFTPIYRNLKAELEDRQVRPTVDQLIEELIPIIEKRFLENGGLSDDFLQKTFSFPNDGMYQSFFIREELKKREAKSHYLRDLLNSLH